MTKRDLESLSNGKSVKIDILEIKSPELDAQLVAENVALADRAPASVSAAP